MPATEKSEQKRESVIDRLFNAGAHFGFSRARRHPSVVPFLYGTKQGTDIFNLEETAALLEDATAYIQTLGAEGKKVLFVGTKEEVSALVRSTADSLNAPYVVNRWIGGMLTNFSEIKKRIDHLAMLRTQMDTGELERKYTKRERLSVSREIDKLTFNFGGVAEVDKLPAAMVVVDPRHDAIAVEEAHRMHIPVIAVMSSDCDAARITKPILVNDAHTKSVKLVLDELAQAYTAGKNTYTAGAQKQTEQASTDMKSAD